MTKRSQMSQSDITRFVTEAFEDYQEQMMLYAIGLKRIYRRLGIVDAEDLVMEVFLKMLNQPDYFHANLQEKKIGFLYTIIKNHAITVMRRKQCFDHIEIFLKEESINLIDPYRQSPEERVAFLLQQFEPFLDELDLIIMKYFFEGYLLKDIAEELGFTQSMVYSRFNRIKKKIENNFDEDFFFD